MVAPKTDENPLAALANSEVAEDITAEVNVPQEVKDFVHAAHVAWKDAPKKWRKVLLADVETVNDVIRHAVNYAKAKGLTFRVQKHDGDPRILRYKVTDKVRKSPTGQSSAPTSDVPTGDKTNG